MEQKATTRVLVISSASAVVVNEANEEKLDRNSMVSVVWRRLGLVLLTRSATTPLSEVTALPLVSEANLME